MANVCTTLMPEKHCSRNVTAASLAWTLSRSTRLVILLVSANMAKRTGKNGNKTAVSLTEVVKQMDKFCRVHGVSATFLSSHSTLH